jgi:hypothetical protein
MFDVRADCRELLHADLMSKTRMICVTNRPKDSFTQTSGTVRLNRGDQTRACCRVEHLMRKLDLTNLSADITRLRNLGRTDLMLYEACDFIGDGDKLEVGLALMDYSRSYCCHGKCETSYLH